jgi:hypothetical protein
MTADAYVHGGRWIADCTRPFCANAEMLQPRQGVFCCSNCRQVDDVRWPPEANELWEVLAVRPVPQTRNWAPAGHRQAVACGVPDGETVADLVDENRRYGVT